MTKLPVEPLKFVEMNNVRITIRPVSSNDTRDNLGFWSVDIDSITIIPGDMNFSGYGDTPRTAYEHAVIAFYSGIPNAFVDRNGKLHGTGTTIS